MGLKEELAWAGSTKKLRRKIKARKPGDITRSTIETMTEVVQKEEQALIDRIFLVILNYYLRKDKKKNGTTLSVSKSVS